MNSLNTLQAIDKQIEQAKELVELGKAMERLRSNREFKKVIIDGYLSAEAVRLVHLKADPNMQKPESQAAIVKQMDAIGSFAEYMTVLIQQASLAQKAVETGEADKEDFLAEGNE